MPKFMYYLTVACEFLICLHILGEFYGWLGFVVMLYFTYYVGERLKELENKE